MRRFPIFLKRLFYLVLTCACLFAGWLFYLSFFTPQWHAFVFAPSDKSWGVKDVGRYWSKDECISGTTLQIKSGIQLSNGQKANGGKCGRNCNDEDFMFNFDGQGSGVDFNCEESVTF